MNTKAEFETRCGELATELNKLLCADPYRKDYTIRHNPKTGAYLTTESSTDRVIFSPQSYCAFVDRDGLRWHLVRQLSGEPFFAEIAD